jgi:hypothetical protein
VGQQKRTTASGASYTPTPPTQTVWQHDDEAIRRLGETVPESHWSRQATQPLGPRWPSQMRRRVAERRFSQIARRESRAMRWGAGWGATLAVFICALALLLALANGWLPGPSMAPDSGPWPIPVQSAPQSPKHATPGATAIPTSTALPSATAQPTATAAATPQPTATPMPNPTATPNPTPRPIATP